MPLSPPHSFTDTQTDILGFLRNPSLLNLHSPRLSPISPELELNPPYLLGSAFPVSPDRRSGWPLVDPYSYQVPLYDYATSFLLPDCPAMFEPGIEGSLSSCLAWPTLDPSECTDRLINADIGVSLAIRSTKCICGCGGDPCLPQRQYRRSKDDPLEDHRVGELITFKVHGECGMPLRDAYRGLSGRDEPMFVGSRTSISIRLQV